MRSKDMWVIDENEHDEDNVLYADNGVCETYNRYDWRPEAIKDTLSYPYEEAGEEETNFRTKLKEKWKSFREWIGDRDTIITVQIIQGGAIAFLAIANLLTLSLVFLL